MAKRKSTFVNMVVVLFSVSLISATTLAFVYKITKKPIEKSKLEKKKNAIKNVLGDFDNDPVADMFTIVADKDTLECYPAKKDGKITGYAVKTFSNKGFSGKILIMTGFDINGKIKKTAVLEHHETPGLGDKIQREKSNFSMQFDNMDIAEIPDKDNDGIIVEVTKDNGTVDAVTAATVTSRAFCDAVERSYKAFKKIKK